jgi:hypothetical protein
MCENIIKKHDDAVYLYNRTRAKALAVAEKGGAVCASAQELAEKADVIITMVPRSEDSRAVYVSILPQLGEGKLCIDMSTIDPAVSCEIAGFVKAAGAAFIDAPVVKSRPAAEARHAGIYVGGEEADFERALPVLGYMGANIKRMGPNGAGLVMKIATTPWFPKSKRRQRDGAAWRERPASPWPTRPGHLLRRRAERLSGRQDRRAGKGGFHHCLLRREHGKGREHRPLPGRGAGTAPAGEENAGAVYAQALALGCAKEDFSPPSRRCGCGLKSLRSEEA